MRIYRYDRYERPQDVLYADTSLAENIRSAIMAVQKRIHSALKLADEPGFVRSLENLDHALDNFISDEVDPIMTLLENAQADIDKGCVE